VIGFSGYRTALVFGPMAVVMIGSSALAGRWVARVGSRTPMAVGCVVAGLGVLLTDVALRGSVSSAGLSAALVLAGVGFGVTVVPVTSVALAVVPAVVPAERSGMAASATNTSRELGGRRRGRGPRFRRETAT